MDRRAVRGRHGVGPAVLGRGRAHVPLLLAPGRAGPDTRGRAHRTGHHEPALGPARLGDLRRVRTRHRLLHVPQGCPLMVSTPIVYSLRPILGDTFTTYFARFSDIVAVLAVVFGLAGSLAAGVLLTRAGMTEVFGTPATNTMSIIIMVMAAAFIT